jgi:hypothetical protein
MKFTGIPLLVQLDIRKYPLGSTEIPFLVHPDPGIRAAVRENVLTNMEEKLKFEKLKINYVNWCDATPLMQRCNEGDHRGGFEDLN